MRRTRCVATGRILTRGHVTRAGSRRSSGLQCEPGIARKRRGTAQRIAAHRLSAVSRGASAHQRRRSALGLETSGTVKKSAQRVAALPRGTPCQGTATVDGLRGCLLLILCRTAVCGVATGGVAADIVSAVAECCPAHNRRFSSLVKKASCTRVVRTRRFATQPWCAVCKRAPAFNAVCAGLERKARRTRERCVAAMEVAAQLIGAVRRHRATRNGALSRFRLKPTCADEVTTRGVATHGRVAGTDVGATRDRDGVGLLHVRRRTRKASIGAHRIATDSIGTCAATQHGALCSEAGGAGVGRACRVATLGCGAIAHS